MPASTRRMSDGPVGVYAEVAPRLHHAVPELDAPAPVAQVDLVADLAAPPCARHHHGDAIQVGLPEPVVAQPQTPRLRRVCARPPSTWGPGPAWATRQVRRSARRDRNSGRRPSRKAARRCPPAPARSGFSPRRSRTGSFTMPPSSAPMRTYLPWPTAHFDRSRGVSRLVNSEGIRAGDLDLALDAHVPHGDAGQQFLVFGVEVVVAGGEEHVVVDGIALAAGAQGGLEVG